MPERGTSCSPGHDPRPGILSVNKSALSSTSQLCSADCYLDVRTCCISSEGQQPGLTDDISRSVKLDNQETVLNNRLSKHQQFKTIRSQARPASVQSTLIIARVGACAEADTQEENKGKSKRQIKLPQDHVVIIMLFSPTSIPVSP